MTNADIEEIFSALGSITIKRMFGGKGIYCSGRIIAVEVRGELMLKADAVSAPAFGEAGARQWTYEGRNGNAVKMPYWTIPETAFDDPEIMATWVRRAYDAARRA